MVPLPPTVHGTFIHLQGVGPRTEGRLWRQGITTWQVFRERSKVDGISDQRKCALEHELDMVEARLLDGDISELARRLPFGEHWRLFPMIKQGVRYMDIETTGLSQSSCVTIIGIARHSGRGKDLLYRPLIRGFDLARSTFCEVMEGSTAMVTFNGSTFDLPMIRREMGDIVPNIPHIDLRHLACRAGLTGGLKSLERRLGISRDAEVQMLAGYDAVRLWRTWERKRHKRALEILVDYNREDVVNLAPLADILYEVLERRLKGRMEGPA